MYQEAVTYFEAIAVNHIRIQHSPSEQRFFRMSIEELYVGSSSTISSIDKFVLILVDVKSKINETPQPFKNYEVLFYIMRSATDTDFENEADSFAGAESVVDDILRRIRYDSNENHPFFGRGMDALRDVSISPETIYQGSVKLVGYSCYFTYKIQFNPTYDPSKFGL